jgi:predicted exporter
MTSTRRISYLVARFTEPREFVEDLARDVDLVERKVARPAMQGTVTRVSVHDGAIVADRPVLLETLIGDLWGTADDAKVQAAATAAVNELEHALAIGLQVRAGVLETRNA